MLAQINISSEMFDRLYAEYKPKFIIIAKSYVHDLQVAEDLVTDSFVYFWENHATLKLEGNTQAFILGIVKKKCAMFLREQKIHSQVHQNIYNFSQWELKQDIAVLEDCELTKQIFVRDVQAIFNSHIHSLPEITRKVYLASRDGNLTYQEIAARFNLSPRQVDREMQKALSSLRIVLRDYLPIILITLNFLKNR